MKIDNMRAKIEKRCVKCGRRGVRRGTTCKGCKRLGEIRRMASAQTSCQCGKLRNRLKEGQTCRACYLKKRATEFLVSIGEREPQPHEKEKQDNG